MHGRGPLIGIRMTQFGALAGRMHLIPRAA
jgi:hypothetical protein